MKKDTFFEKGIFFPVRSLCSINNMQIKRYLIYNMHKEYTLKLVIIVEKNKSS